MIAVVILAATQLLTLVAFGLHLAHHRIYDKHRAKADAVVFEWLRLNTDIAQVIVKHLGIEGVQVRVSESTWLRSQGIDPS